MLFAPFTSTHNSSFAYLPIPTSLATQFTLKRRHTGCPSAISEKVQHHCQTAFTKNASSIRPLPVYTTKLYIPFYYWRCLVAYNTHEQGYTALSRAAKRKRKKWERKAKDPGTEVVVAGKKGGSKMSTAPGIPSRSPMQVLTRPNVA